MESPAKAHTIEKYLGSDFKVLASVGHIRKDTKVDKATFDAAVEKVYRKEVKKIWEKAHELGYGSYFVKQEGSEVTDDHVYVNQLARIPCVDIINYDPVYENSSFGPTWHTVNDTPENISRDALKAVGQTMVEVLAEVKP